MYLGLHCVRLFYINVMYDTLFSHKPSYCTLKYIYIYIYIYIYVCRLSCYRASERIDIIIQVLKSTLNKLLEYYVLGHIALLYPPMKK